MTDPAVLNQLCLCPSIARKATTEVNMPITKEFAIEMEDRPGTLGKFCQVLADRGVNIVSFQSYPHEGKSEVRLVVDNPTNAKKVLDGQSASYTERDVVQLKLASSGRIGPRGVPVG